MAKSKWMLTVVSAVMAGAVTVAAPVANAAEEKKLTPVEEGKKLAFDRSKGNCLACHMIADGTSPGEIGPPLMAMQARYPDKQKLFDKIWGKPGTEGMPETMMLPFGQNKVLSDDEINKVVEFLYTL